MKKILIFSYIITVWSQCNLLHAQHWHYHNPTAWFDINTIETPAPGLIIVGGGHEARDSVQTIFQSTDYGVTWIENPHDGLAPWNRSIAFSDRLHGIAVGYDGRIIRTDDAGQDWGYNMYPINRDFNKVVYTGSGTYYVAGGNKTRDSIQTILKSTDNGFTWNVIYDNPGPWLRSITFTDALHGFAVGNNGVIIATTNGGNSWSSVSAPIQRDFNAITFINADTGYIAGGLDSGLFSRRTILRTVNGGSNWSVHSDTTGGIINDISFASDMEGYIVGDFASVLKTTDRGSNWSPIVIDTNLTGNETFNAVKFYNKNFGAIGGKRGVLYTYLDLPVEAYTFGVSQVGTTDATLLGGINTHNKNAVYSLVYSNNIHFTSCVTTPGVNALSDSLILVSKQLKGLTPNTTYYYSFKATSLTDTVYGDTLSFYTGVNPSSLFQTLDATNVTTWWAYLNGLINKFPEPVNLFFEYGRTPAFGQRIAADPSTVNDTLMYNIRAYITGLLTNSRYFFRLIGVSGTSVYYGDTKMFYAANLPYVGTGYATNITMSSALLNGNMTNNGLPAALKFDYGLTSYYGSEVNAFPDTARGTGSVFATYSLTGLTPGTTYHFRFKAISAAGTSYGGDTTFITGIPSASTMPASDISSSSARLNAVVNSNNNPTAIKFNWGLTSAYGNEVIASPDSAFGNINAVASYYLNGLQENTTYHYCVKVICSLGIVYGNDVTFHTGPVNPTVTTQRADEISFHSAKLNAVVNPHGNATAIIFDYGYTASYGNEISANIPTSSDSADLNIYTRLNGLTSNTLYHFRITAFTSTDTVFGNDMIFFTGPSEIPNFDFELWTTTTRAKPDGWDFTVGKVSQYTPACHNSFAVKIENFRYKSSKHLQPGVLLIGNTVDDMHFIGGTPFNARPDTISGCFNYFIPANDTALILLKLKRQGVIISDNWFKIAGTSSGSFTELKFPIPYTSAGNADSIIIGLISTDIRFQNEQFPLGGYLIADNIHFSGTSENIPNNDFESWQINTQYSLDNWYSGHDDPIHPENYHFSRTNDAQHGNFAVLLQNYLNPTDTLSGWFSTGRNWNTPDFIVNARHQSLTGYYKFLPENNDTMNVFVSMFKNHIPVGLGNFQSAAVQADYTPFIADIFIQDTIVPDSGQISIQACGHRPLGNSKLYIDNLNFDGFLSGVKAPPLTATSNFDFNVYPNPFSDQATVSFTLDQDEQVVVRLFDLSGKQLALLTNGYFKSGRNKINLPASGFDKGFYICVINTKTNVLSKKIIIY